MTQLDSQQDLSPELLDLYDHEKVIEQGLASFIDVGCALIAIKADRKYRYIGYVTFEDYCNERWNISKTQANRLVSAASIATELIEMAPIGAIPTPANESQVRPLSSVPADQRAEVWAEAVEAASGEQPTAKQVEQAAAKRKPPKKSHPATFSDAIINVIGNHLPESGVVLDPFAGEGGIHKLATDERTTVGVELQPKWADKHPNTIVGSALDLSTVVEAESVDAIATSPTYGNRMADHHNANDDSVRLTYTHTHGAPLEPDNSGLLQWGPEYRAFHEQAWDEAVRVLKTGGTFTINVKNHIRGGEVQRVVEWHITTLMIRYGMELVALDVVPTKGLMAGANADSRTDYEVVATFRKVQL